MTSGAVGLALLLAAQASALGVLASRLARGRRRLPPVRPRPDGPHDTRVSVVVPTRNEAARLRPCLDGLRRQEAPLFEILVVDGGSTDGTRELVAQAARVDARLRLLDEPPRPAGRVGRPWAIAAGCAAARGDWVLVVDADAAPRAGMVGGVVAAATARGYDAVSCAPRIVAPGAGARWLQPALLTTLVYRFGPVGVDTPPERTMANGQCMLLRRDVLARAGGYDVASASYCDDVQLVRHLAARGARVGFLDGAALLDVEMYPTAAATWRGWPRSLNLRDATSPAWRVVDSAFLLLTQALPLPLLLLAAAGAFRSLGGAAFVVVGVNLLLLAVRLLLLGATAPSFARRGLAYWLSPLADLPVVLRVVQTTIERPREWRGRSQREARSAVTAAAR